MHKAISAPQIGENESEACHENNDHDQELSRFGERFSYVVCPVCQLDSGTNELHTTTPYKHICQSFLESLQQANITLDNALIDIFFKL